MAEHYDEDAVSRAPISDDRLTSYNYRAKVQTVLREDPFIVKFTDLKEADDFRRRARAEPFELGKWTIRPADIDSVVIETPHRIVVHPTPVEARVRPPR